MRAATFLALRQNYPDLPRPYRSPLGKFGAWVTIAICVVTLLCQVQDDSFLRGSIWVMAWLGLGAVYYAVVARHRLVLSPDDMAATLCVST